MLGYCCTGPLILNISALLNKESMSYLNQATFFQLHATAQVDYCWIYLNQEQYENKYEKTNGTFGNGGSHDIITNMVLYVKMLVPKEKVWK